MVRPHAKPVSGVSVVLPPVRVEPELEQALRQLAEEEGRTLSDVVRRGLRAVVKERRQERTR